MIDKKLIQLIDFYLDNQPKPDALRKVLYDYASDLGKLLELIVSYIELEDKDKLKLVANIARAREERVDKPEMDVFESVEQQKYFMILESVDWHRGKAADILRVHKSVVSAKIKHWWPERLRKPMADRKEEIFNALEKHHWNRSRAASELGCSVQPIYTAINRWWPERLDASKRANRPKLKVVGSQENKS